MSCNFCNFNDLCCCFQEVLQGRGCFLYRLLCCPFVLPYHAIRIFCGACTWIYCGWICTPSCCQGNCWDKFDDEEFPPDYNSIGQLKGDTASGVLYGVGAVEWKRADEICVDDEESRSQLFHGSIEAGDLQQGAIGNCWLIAALACVAERPEILQQCILSKSISAEGKYYFRLWNQIRDKKGTEWVKIVIDDYIPCYQGTTDPKFAKAHDTEMWAVLIEKAFAKMYGSYSKLEGGLMSWGLTALTGNPAVLFDRNNGRTWRAAVGGYYSEDEFNDDAFYDLLIRQRRNGAFICCAGVPATNPMGLISGHAYSVIQLRRVRIPLTTDYFNMVQIRNPHGGGEWKGAWSDNSSSWDNNPIVKAVLQGPNELKEDGAFWMQWSDFVKFWSSIHIVDCETNIKTVGIPVYNEHNPCGPVYACCCGCLDYWLCCTGLKRLYFGRPGAHDVAGMKIDMDSKCGIDQSGCYCRLLHGQAVEYDELSEEVRSDSGSEG